jgi:Ca2+-binding EF-hand superfamily protein
LFKEFDVSGDGQLSKAEVGKLLARFFKERDPEEILEEFLQYADTSKDGVITYEEFEAFFR